MGRSPVGAGDERWRTAELRRRRSSRMWHNSGWGLVLQIDERMGFTGVGSVVDEQPPRVARMFQLVAH